MPILATGSGSGSGAHRDACEIARPYMESGRADRPSSEPGVAHHRLYAVVGIHEVNGEKQAFIAAIVNHLPCVAHAEWITVFFMPFFPSPGRMVGIGWNDPDRVAFLKDTLGSFLGVTPKRGPIARTFRRLTGVACRRRVYYGFPETCLSSARKRNGCSKDCASQKRGTKELRVLHDNERDRRKRSICSAGRDLCLRLGSREAFPAWRSSEMDRAESRHCPTRRRCLCAIRPADKSFAECGWVKTFGIRLATLTHSR